MSDLIDRQLAIDTLMAWEEDSIWDEECLKHRGEPYWISPSDVVENLPSAEPERKKGKWIKQPYKSGKYVIFRCSVCLMDSGFGHIESKWANYCPNCGADMRGKQDE